MPELHLVEKYLTPNPYSRCGMKMDRPRGLVYHWPSKPGQGAAGVWKYFEALKDQIPNEAGKVLRKASAHFVIDLDGTVYQLMPIPDPPTGRGGEVAFHAGPQADTIPEALERFDSFPNGCLLGIEMCHADLTGRLTYPTGAAAVELGRRLCEMYYLDPESEVVRHYDITRKYCPKWYVDHPGDWTGFQKAIKKRMLASACAGAKDGDC